MVELIPDEIKKLRYIFKPYCNGIYLRDDAPEEAREAYDKYLDWSRKNGENEQ